MGHFVLLEEVRAVPHRLMSPIQHSPGRCCIIAIIQAMIMARYAIMWVVVSMMKRWYCTIVYVYVPHEHVLYMHRFSMIICIQCVYPNGTSCNSH